ncbi:hypothetical protein [Flavobacterium humi]|uniref:Uncharacterized protein n=1 Tax=Flavobacterium humi TaxID=2562683 RepID=A0A4Z0L4V9_9FLAO|nr:hypothetical protein [Flavobacterium humi]TGD57284.1 hypothetical protein E4635_11715 [Flavobacterium humi]
MSETGHAKNVANFQDLISFCEGYGSTYNPSKENLKIVSMLNQYQRSLDRLYQVKTDKTGFDIATNNRRNEFDDLKRLSTKVLSAFMVSGADKLAIDDVNSIQKKIQGRSSKKIKEEATGEDIKRISTAQQSFDRFIDHFANLLQVLEQNPVYNPNEMELKLTSLRMKFESMKRVNKDLTDAYTQYSNAMIRRNHALYDASTGLVQTAKEVKLYIRSIFGATSPQFRQVNCIEFRMMKE